MKRIRATSIPHPSYDLDNDGYVSMQDYRLAKRFDLDGNGVLGEPPSPAPPMPPLC